MNVKVEDLLYLAGGNTKVIIGFQSYDKFYEIWRGKVDDIDWDDIPFGYRVIENVAVVEGEDWLQIWV